MILRCFIVLVLVFKCMFLEAKTIDFDFLVDYMLKNSLTLKNEVLTIQSTQSDLNIFQSELYPQISMGLKKYNNKEIYENSSFLKDEAYIDIRYTLYDFGKSEFKENAYKKAIEVSLSNFCLKELEMKLTLLKYYQEQLKLNTILQLNTMIIEKEKENLEIGEKLLKAKELNTNDVLNISLSLSKNTINYMQTLEKKKKNIQDIYLVIGDNNENNLNIQESIFKEISLNEIIPVPFSNTLEAQKLKNELALKNEQLKENDTYFSPTLSLFSNYNTNYINSKTSSTLKWRLSKF